MIPTRVLFLDCDGVINHTAWWRTARATFEALTAAQQEESKHIDAWTFAADPACVRLVAQLCRLNDAHIVVSSVWRRGAMERVRTLFPDLLHPTDPATTLAEPGGDRRRGAQIAEWLSRHPEVTRWAIVDDDSDMLPNQRAHFVQTHVNTGITLHHVAALTALLGDPA